MYYAVSLMYKSERSDSTSPLWEERIILVEALDENDVITKANRFAKEYEVEFDVSDAAQVKWCFEKVESIFLIDDQLNDGCELFSRFLRNSEAESILTPFED